MNVFKGKIDCCGYLFLIIIPPLVQCILLQIKADNLFYITAILLTLSIIYDAYGRYQKDKSRKIKRIIILMGALGVYLSCVVIALGVVILVKGAFPDWCLLFYIPIAFILVYTTACLVGYISKGLRKL